MSRIGRKPIEIPSSVQVETADGRVKVKGKLGELAFDLPESITAKLENSELSFTRGDDSKRQRALHGLSRALVANMIHGVSQGFSKNLEVVGVGYRCEQRGKALQLALGFSHRVVFIPPESVEIKITSPNNFTVSGIDKAVVGEIAAKIRAIKPPEPYKGKGIKYAGEHIRRKAGKTAGA